MRLRKTWMGICVWVIFLVGMIFAIGVTGFVSGLFPSYDRYIVAGGTFVICFVACAIISFIGTRLGDLVYRIDGIEEWKKPLWLEILIPVATSVITFFTFNSFFGLVSDYSGDMSLYDSAVVAASGQAMKPVGALENAYIMILRTMMGFLGNSLSVVSTLNLFLRILMVLFLYIAIRTGLGMAAAVVFAGASCAIPAFGYTLCSVDSAQLGFTAIAFELMLVILYVRGFERRFGSRWLYKIVSILIGAFIGMMTYIDVTAVAVVVFLLAAWELADMYGETFNICINEILLLLAGAMSFFGMLFLEGGFGGVQDTYYHWTWRFYGFNESAWLLMIRNSVPNTWFALGLLTLAFVPVIMYLAKDRTEKITPWLIFTVLVVISSVFLGDTAANSEVILISTMLLCVSCGICCFAYVEGKDDAVAEPDDEEDSEVAEETEEESLKAEEACTDDKTGAESFEKADSQVEIATEDKQNENTESEYKADEAGETKGNTKEEKNTVVEKEKSKEEKPRFVPEGMVLPVGEEDEEDLVPNFNMKRPHMEDIGILSVGGPKKDESASRKKDDFDIMVDPDDDFDI